jgi:hypothetical protein
VRIRHLTLSIVMLAVICPNLFFGHSQAQSRGKLIKVEKVWDGEIRLALRRQAPPEGFIANEKAWAKLWMAYRGNDELPKIDFDKQMILVVVSGDPNNIVYDPRGLILNKRGDLSVFYYTTLMGFTNPETCKYIFMLISRKGVKSISGIPVPKG